MFWRSNYKRNLQLVSSKNTILNVRQLFTCLKRANRDLQPPQSAPKPSDSESNEVSLQKQKVVKCTQDQWIVKPNKEEIELFKNSKVLPRRPIDLEKSVVCRLVDLNEPVTSPVGSAVAYSQYGIGRNEFTRLVLCAVLACSLFIYLGTWQLQRSAWKEQLLIDRQQALERPRITIDSFKNLPESFVPYTRVKASGVLDFDHMFLVGPRAPLKLVHGSSSGYLVIVPLRFQDGSCILTNLGWIKDQDVFGLNPSPIWATVCGVVITSESSESGAASLKQNITAPLRRLGIVNNITSSFGVEKPRRLMRDDSRLVYRRLDPSHMGRMVSSTNVDLPSQYILCLYDDLMDGQVVDFGKEGGTSYDAVSNLYADFERKSPSDYMLMYASPNVHINYAYQWFLMAFAIAAMTVHRLAYIVRLSKTLKGASCAS